MGFLPVAFQVNIHYIIHMKRELQKFQIKDLWSLAKEVRKESEEDKEREMEIGERISSLKRSLRKTVEILGGPDGYT